MTGCYMLVEKNRHCIAFMLWDGCAREVVSLSVCLCVGSRMKGDGWACTDRHMGRPVASSDQKSWFTTKLRSETHSSVWEQDRHGWSAHAHACTNTPTQIHSQAQVQRLWCSVCAFVFGISEVEKGWERGKAIHRGILFVKVNAAIKT